MKNLMKLSIFFLLTDDGVFYAVLNQCSKSMSWMNVKDYYKANDAGVGVYCT